MIHQTFKSVRRVGAWAWVLVSVSAGSQLLAGDSVRPLQIVHVDAPHGQVDERADQDGLTWVILHRNGLKVVDVESGEAVDRQSVRDEDHWESEQGGLWVTMDAKYFAYLGSTRRSLMVAATADGRMLAEANSIDLFQQPVWLHRCFLSADATYFLTTALDKKRRQILHRVDLFPSPRITASQDLGPLPHHMFATPAPTGFVVSVPVDDTGRAPQGRWLQIFDQQLRLQHKEKVTGPTSVLAVIDLPNPLIVLNGLACIPGSRTPGEPSWLIVELVRGGTAEPNGRREFTMRTKLAAKQYIMTAAFSPDGKWLVTGRVDSHTTLDIWPSKGGSRHREVHLEGGQHKLQLPSNMVIRNLAFSASGRFLSAGDASNAYLLDFNELIESNSSTQ